MMKVEKSTVIAVLTRNLLKKKILNQVQNDGGHFSILLFIMMLLVPLFCMAQESYEYKLIAEINKKATFITIDKLGNIYASDGTSIDKYNERGNLLFSYSTLSMGRISFIDTYNPLKILVFSKNFMRLLFLDHKLAAQQGAYILSDLNTLPTCVCMSYDNGFWVYDESVKQLFRYDAQQNLTNKSADITHFTEKKLNPSFIKETESGFLLLNDKENGILVFDRFGTYLKTLPVFTDYFYIMNNQILYIQDDMLKSIHIQNLQQLTITLPETAIQQLCIANKKMVVLTKENVVKVYEIKN